MYPRCVQVTGKGRTHAEAAARLNRALSEFRVRGVKTNISFLKNVLSHPEFIKGAITTRFIDENPNLLRTTPQQNRGQKALHYLANVIVNGPATPLATNIKPALKAPVVPALSGPSLWLSGYACEHDGRSQDGSAMHRLHLATFTCRTQ